MEQKFARSYEPWVCLWMMNQKPPKKLRFRKLTREKRL